MRALTTILILFVSMQCYGQGYWLDDFLDDKEAKHIDLKIAERYLDSALHEISSTRADLQRLTCQIAREYYRMGLITKGDACRKLIDKSNNLYFENQRIKGLASSQSLEYLRSEILKTTQLGRIYIAEAFIRKGKANEAISFVLSNAKENWEKERLVQVTCEHLADIREIVKFYPMIGYDYPKPIYAELSKRINNKSITSEVATSILSSLKLPEEKPDENPANSKYLTWLSQYKSQTKFELTREVFANLLVYQNFGADDDVVYFLVTKGLMDHALEVTDTVQGFNKLNQYQEIIKGYIEHGKVKEANVLMSRLMKTENCNDCVLKGIETFLSKSDEKNAMIWRQEYFTDSFYNELSTDYFIRYFLLKGDFKRVENTIPTVKRGATRAFSYFEVARYYMGIKWKHAEV